jgi:hypothetical protein
MSEAPSRSAWVNSALIRRITGASSWLSSRSSILGISCNNRERSRSWAMSPASAAAPASALLYSAAISSSNCTVSTRRADTGTPSVRRTSASAPGWASLRTEISASWSSMEVTTTPLALAKAYGIRIAPGFIICVPGWGTA